MPIVIVTSPDGTVQEMEIENGVSIMQALVSEGIEGIVGECGGSAMCATCHIYVDESQIGLLPDVDAVEHEMLESTTSERRSNSRLSCQILMAPELDGLKLTLPPTQL